MTNGQELSIYVRKTLANFDLDISQKAQIQNVVGGMFEPEDLDLAIIDIELMAVDLDIAGLIRLLKQLPKPDTSNSIQLYINNDRVNIQQYLDPTQTGVREVKGVSSKSSSEMTLHEYSYTVHGSTRFDGFHNNEVFGASVGVGSNPKRSKKLIMFCPTAFKLITAEIIDKELLRNFDLKSYESVDAIPDEDGKLLAYLTNVIGTSVLIDEYLEKVWCSTATKSTHTPTATEIEPPKPYDGVVGELTEVGITDAELDAMDNVMIGVDKGGMRTPKDKMKFKSSKHSKGGKWWLMSTKQHWYIMY